MDDGKYKWVTHEFQSDELQIEANESSGKMKILKSEIRRQFTSEWVDMKRLIKWKKNMLVKLKVFKLNYF